MNLRNYATMDPNLLLGLINTGLRNDTVETDLTGFCRKHDIAQDIVEQRLAEVGYEYNSELNQFRFRSPSES